MTGESVNGVTDPATVARMLRLFRIAERAQPLPGSCLRRSLALQRVLARRRVPAALVIGVKKNGVKLEGHAWVEVAGTGVGESQAVNAYQPLGLPNEPRPDFIRGFQR